MTGVQTWCSSDLPITRQVARSQADEAGGRNRSRRARGGSRGRRCSRAQCRTGVPPPPPSWTLAPRPRSPNTSHSPLARSFLGFVTPAARSSSAFADFARGAAAERQRKSPYPLVPVREAISLIFKNTYITPIQSINLSESLLGHVLAEDVAAAHAIPQRPTTNVDGYAVRCEH